MGQGELLDDRETGMNGICSRLDLNESAGEPRFPPILGLLNRGERQLSGCPAVTLPLSGVLQRSPDVNVVPRNSVALVYFV